MKSRSFFPTLILGFTVLQGCGAARPSKFYQLSPASEKSARLDPAPYPVTLVLGPITTSRLYRDDRVVYTSSNGEAMGRYEYQRWAEPPSEMINGVLLRELQVSGRYQHVYLLRSEARGNYLLRGHLHDFREIDGKPLTARVAFDFELRDSKTGTAVWTHSYSHDEPVDGRDVTAVVAALNRNVQSGLSEVMDGLDEYFSTQTAATSAVVQ